ncbi:hypothetical protein HanRHA438_Chr15g0698801 [Helianthus annuus]|nr:hypothetical protein HanRHA438_Chr15g0698801 [Helianthus annuus]
MRNLAPPAHTLPETSSHHTSCKQMIHGLFPMPHKGHETSDTGIPLPLKATRVRSTLFELS